MKPPLPICTNFIICRQIVEHGGGEFSLMHIARQVISRAFPAKLTLGFFAEWVSAHGDYLAEVQLQTLEGQLVWRHGPTELVSLPNPLAVHTFKLSYTPIFPQPGTYEFLLLANGEEVARQRFRADVAPKQAAR
jgi:hypothetical protein